MKPVIGINSTIHVSETGEVSFAVGCGYADSVVKAGGIPVILPPIDDAADIARQTAMCDGFLFIGGHDINPARLGQPCHPMTTIMDPRREDFDFALIGQVIAARKPFLAVCLGCQEINAALGGKIIQDIPSQTNSSVPHSRQQSPCVNRHKVVIESGTQLRAVLGADEISANSSHHQAIGQPPPRGALVSARCPDDGIIEAIELTDHPFGIAIQWHPERLAGETEHLRLFQALVEHATAGKD
ncbi:MAG: gamma-glutamyl-gamma-aminobutyrate hydrolase family protein [bacterium]